jgi:predicted metal-dependent TIM-barrel fold hydrolase
MNIDRPTADRFSCNSESGTAAACPCCGVAISAAQLEAMLDTARRTPANAGRLVTPGQTGRRFIDPHAHMIARTTDDYAAMARAGVVAVIEPAFWLGQPRTSAGTYADYLATITGFERFRAGQFGIRHYCTVGLNPKEANNQALAEAVMEILPEFALKEGVVAIGELGYDEQTPLEDKYFRAQIELADKLDLPILVHTPHRDKKQGTLRSLAVLKEHGFDPARCVIDHNNEETVQDVLDAGFWVAFSIYPDTKMSEERMVEIARRYGPERLIANSACDWGVSDPLAVPKTATLMARAGLEQTTIEQITYANALTVYGASGQLQATDWENPEAVDPAALFDGSSLLRGGAAEAELVQS